ncbi:hypothetical protein CN128_15170 [Sinorhizobium meliloti]|nr:hypothetical protein CN128_15170 [Sinorhizobium meliloti]
MWIWPSFHPGRRRSDRIKPHRNAIGSNMREAGGVARLLTQKKASAGADPALANTLPDRIRASA